MPHLELSYPRPEIAVITLNLPEKRLSIVSRLLDSVVDDTLAIPETLCSYRKFGLESTKQVRWNNLEAPSLEAAPDVENRSQILASTNGEMLEAASAVLPRRQR